MNAHRQKVIIEVLNDFFGIAFFLACLMTFALARFSYSVFFLIFALVYLPYLHHVIERKTHHSFSIGIRIAVAIIGLTVVFFAFANDPTLLETQYNSITTSLPGFG